MDNDELVRLKYAEEAHTNAVGEAIAAIYNRNSTLAQDELLFRCGILDRLSVRTECGTDVVLTHTDEGHAIASGPDEVLKRFADRGETLVRIAGFGPVELKQLSVWALLDIEFEAELGVNSFHFLPAWCREAVYDEWLARREDGITSDEEGEE